MAEWIEKSLGEIAEVTKLAGFEFTKYIKYIDNGEIIALRALNLRNGELDLSDIKRISRKVSEGLTRSKIYKDDILLTYTGNGYGDCAIIEENDKYHLAPNICKIVPNQDVIFPYYLYCYISSNAFYNQMSNNMTGSGQPTIPMKTIRLLKIPVPDMSVQIKIANIIQSLNHKIRNNKVINNNLLEQALTVFSTQFAALDRNGCIGDYCSVKSGFAFKSSWWTTNGVKVIKIGSINQDNLNLSECSYVDEDKVDKAKDFKVIAGDLLIAMTGATIGKFAMVPYSSDTLLVNQRVGKFFLGNNPVEKLPFIYCTLKQPDVYYEIVNRGQGSAQPNISASDIMSISCVIPSKEAINKFNKTLQPLFDLIISNQRENQQLSTLRDSLLPKLMSGELDVSDIDL